MRRRLILSPDAEEAIQSAFRWYGHTHEDLAFRFKAESTVTLQRIVRNPYQFPVISDRVRRALMNRFPYAIYFTLKLGTVFVLTVLHQRRFNPWHRA